MNEGKNKKYNRRLLEAMETDRKLGSRGENIGRNWTKKLETTVQINNDNNSKNYCVLKTFSKASLAIIKKNFSKSF